MPNRADYETLLNLKYKLQIELERNNYDKVKALYTEFCDTYEKATGCSFEDKVSQSTLEDIKRILDRNNNEFEKADEYIDTEDIKE